MSGDGEGRGKGEWMREKVEEGELKMLTPLYYSAHIPLFLYPFLNTVSKTRPFEYLRLTSLGVIGALVKVYTSTIF